MDVLSEDIKKQVTHKIQDKDKFSIDEDRLILEKPTTRTQVSSSTAM